MFRRPDGVRDCAMGLAARIPSYFQLRLFSREFGRPRHCNECDNCFQLDGDVAVIVSASTSSGSSQAPLGRSWHCVADKVSSLVQTGRYDHLYWTAPRSCDSAFSGDRDERVLHMMSRCRPSTKQGDQHHQSGFTLIELLIVIVVLGILAAVVVFALGGVTAQSAKSACNSDAKTVETAIAAYQGNNPGVIPTSTSLTATTAPGPYLKSFPSNSPHYTITIDATTGNVMVATGTAAATAYDTSNQCTNAK